MNMTTPLTAGELCSVANVPYSAFHEWELRGIVRPLTKRRGRGNHKLYSVTTTLAVAVGRGLRASGFDFDVAADVMEILMNLSDADLSAAFLEGRDCLMVCGKHVLPQLVTRESVIANETIDYTAMRAAGLGPVAIDVRAAYRNVRRKVRKFAEQQDNETPKPAAEPVAATGVTASAPDCRMSTD